MLNGLCGALLSLNVPGFIINVLALFAFVIVIMPLFPPSLAALEELFQIVIQEPAMSG